MVTIEDEVFGIDLDCSIEELRFAVIESHGN